jgi:iron-sulfur cluster repair protein YtfE (RIC family)
MSETQAPATPADLARTLPALDALTDKVARVHGPGDPSLIELRSAFVGTAKALTDLAEHTGPYGQAKAAIQGIEQMRALSHGYTPPPNACRTYRAMLDALGKLDAEAVAVLKA